MSMQTICVNGVDLFVRPGTWDTAIANEVIQGDCYRSAHWNPPNPVTVFDVGGHIGSFSKWMAQRLPNARILTFEMDAANQEICEQNLSGLANVTLFKAALGSRSGSVVRGPVHTHNTGGGHVEWERGWDAGDDLLVPAIGIAPFLTEHGVDYIDCLKLDCEGSEFGILDALEDLPGGLRKWVGCVRAEVHARRADAKCIKFVGQLSAGFPFVEVVPTSSPQQQYAYAWR